MYIYDSSSVYTNSFQEAAAQSPSGTHSLDIGFVTCNPQPRNQETQGQESPKTNTQPKMCEKALLAYTCGHSSTQDPRPCARAIHRNRICEGYGFAWAYRDPVVVRLSTKCPDCIQSEEAEARRRANEEFMAHSEAYPSLKEVENEDDKAREQIGRPRYDRSASGTMIVPEGWTSEMNRLPSNANEYHAFLHGTFDPLTRLPDTHIPYRPIPTAPPLLQPGQPLTEAAFQRTVQAAVQHAVQGHLANQQRIRMHAPPQCWTDAGPVVVEEGQYPYVEFRGATATATANANRSPTALDVAAARPGSSRRSSSTVGKQEKGWAPISGGTLEPKKDVAVTPPSRKDSGPDV